MDMISKPDVFQSFIEGQLEDIPGLRFRLMFSGFGIYSNEVFFGIISMENLYFHTSGETKNFTAPLPFYQFYFLLLNF
jgi:TfoX/Sxy family transcriptional regulator of competence genes